MGEWIDLVLSQADAGRTLELAVGAAVQLRLPENPTTGYRWTLVLTPPACAKLAGDAFEPPTSSGLGAAGVRVLDLTASAAPACDLQVSYRRPWESEKSAASPLEYRFVAPKQP